MKFVVVCPNGCEHQKTTAPYRMKYDKVLKKMVPEFTGVIPKCLICNEMMVFAEEDTQIPEFSVGTFKGQPDEKKKEILRKRFDNEIKANAGTEKEERKRSAIKQFIKYDE